MNRRARPSVRRAEDTTLPGQCVGSPGPAGQGPGAGRVWIPTARQHHLPGSLPVPAPCRGPLSNPGEDSELSYAFPTCTARSAFCVTAHRPCPPALTQVRRLRHGEAERAVTRHPNLLFPPLGPWMFTGVLHHSIKTTFPSLPCSYLQSHDHIWPIGSEHSGWGFPPPLC